VLARVLAVGPTFMKPEFWIGKAGAAVVWVVAAIIFAESGLFFGFFLPGDSLLFMTGFLASDGAGAFAAEHGLEAAVSSLQHIPFVLLVALLFVAAVAGDQVGYLFGRRVGPALFDRPDSRLFKQAHVGKAHAFLEKNGPKTIFLARFVPIVRTFAPIVAGVGEMRYRTFITYNIVGGLIWAVGITTLGHVLGNVAFIRDNIEYTIILVVLISLTPVFFEIVKNRREVRAAGAVVVDELEEAVEDIVDRLLDDDDDDRDGADATDGSERDTGAPGPSGGPTER
jgi:membrane-associated protein